jgi:hypothetical protein
MGVPRMNEQTCYPYTTTVYSTPRDEEEETAFGQQSTCIIFSEAICTEEIATQYDTVWRY